jgi:PAS domain S-box-containing protein
LSRLFSAAFTNSKNAMALLDSRRRILDVNGAYLQLLGYKRDEVAGRPFYQFLEGGPAFTEAGWQAALAAGRWEGEAVLVHADGARIAAQWAGSAEMVTGRHLALVVALSTSRWGSHPRRAITPEPEHVPLSRREREVVTLIALGSSGREIADELQIAHDTVRTHARNAMRKTGARSRAQLVAKALGEGLVFN